MVTIQFTGEIRVEGGKFVSLYIRPVTTLDQSNLNVLLFTPDSGLEYDSCATIALTGLTTQGYRVCLASFTPDTCRKDDQ